MRLRSASVICLYNSSAYLEDLLVSIFNQSEALDQLVFVNDSSKDDTLSLLYALLEKYNKDKTEVKVIDLEKNLGVSTAFNIGLAELDADLLFFSGHDDVWEIKRVESTIDLAVSRKETAFFYSPFQCFGESSSLVKSPVSHLDAMVRMMFGNPIGAITVALRVDKIGKRNIRFNARYEGAEDYDLWADLILNGHTSCPINEVTMKYRVSSSQMSRNFDYQSQPVDQLVRRHYLSRILNGLNTPDQDFVVSMIFRSHKIWPGVWPKPVLDKTQSLINFFSERAKKNLYPEFYACLKDLLEKRLAHQQSVG